MHTEHTFAVTSITLPYCKNLKVKQAPWNGWGAERKGTTEEFKNGEIFHYKITIEKVCEKTLLIIKLDRG